MKKWIYLAVTLAVMGLIFYLSAQPSAESSNLSNLVTDKVQHSAISSMTPSVFSSNLNANMRKWAHVYIYVALGASVAATVYAFTERKKHQKLYWLALAGIAAGICLAYSIGDELHQHFVPGRAALASDVFVDAMGFVPGVVLVALICYAVTKINNKK